MSLINDAIKQAGRAAPPPLPTTSELPPLRAVDYRAGIPAWWLGIPVALGVTIGLGGWLLLKGWQGSQRTSIGAQPTEVMAREPIPAAAPPVLTPPPSVPPPKPSASPHPAAPAAAPADALTENPSETSASGHSGADSSPPPPVRAAPAPPPRPHPPPLKLQGIYYRPSNPSAIINSRTVFVGGRIGDARVVAIEPERVRIEWHGQTNVLTLP
jgi:hypothetical protein